MTKEGQKHLDTKEDHLDPRIEGELDKLNQILVEINKVEKDLDEARFSFQRNLRTSARNLDEIEKQIESRSTEYGGIYFKVKEKIKAHVSPSCENIHKLENVKFGHPDVSSDKVNGESMDKARALYSERRTCYVKNLKSQQSSIQALERKYRDSNRQYSDGLQCLELISEEIHSKRNKLEESVEEQSSTNTGEEDSFSDNKSLTTRRQKSKDNTLKPRHRRISQPTLTMDKNLHSLMLELRVDFDFVTEHLGHHHQTLPRRRGTKSFDLGYIEGSDTIVEIPVLSTIEGLMMMNEGVRHEPEGENENDEEEEEEEEEEEDELDPRVEIELEKLNKSSMEINILEKELDEARAVFRQRLTDAAKSLKQLGKKVGSNIDKARPYFEALSQSKKAQSECQNAAVTFEKACQLHKGARETISIAEEKLMNNPGMFDSAWQEMLNNANSRILEAEKEKYKNEQLHHEATMAYLELERRASQLEKQLRKSVNKAKPYFDQRCHYLGYLENQKALVQDLESQYAAAKKQYSDSLKNLEFISEEIHKKRNKKTAKRGECVGAEDGEDAENSPTPPPPQTRRKNTLRRLSEERLKTAMIRQHSHPVGGRKTGRGGLGKYRHSLLLDLDVDFDIDSDEGDFEQSATSSKLPNSPGAKSVDIGCVNLKYYDDYQVLDVSPFLNRDKSPTSLKSPSKKLSYAMIPSIHEPLKHQVEIESKARSDTGASIFSILSSDEHLAPTKPRSGTNGSDFDVISMATKSLERGAALSLASPELHRKGVNVGVDSRKDSRPVLITMDDLDRIKKPTKSLLSRKDSKPVLLNRFSMIAEIDDNVDGGLEIDALDNIPLNDSEKVEADQSTVNVNEDGADTVRVHSNTLDALDNISYDERYIEQTDDELSEDENDHNDVENGDKGDENSDNNIKNDDGNGDNGAETVDDTDELSETKKCEHNIVITNDKNENSVDEDVQDPVQ